MQYDDDGSMFLMNVIIDDDLLWRHAVIVRTFHHNISSLLL